MVLSRGNLLHQIFLSPGIQAQCYELAHFPLFATPGYPRLPPVPALCAKELVAMDHSPWAPLPSGFQVGSWRYEWEVLERGRELKECEVNIFLHLSVIRTWFWNGCLPPQPQPPLGSPSLTRPAPTGPKGWQRPPPCG